MDDRVKSGARSIEVIEFFHRNRRPARAIEIGADLHLAPSSANDLLKTLVNTGYLEFDEQTKAYFLGARAALFARWASSLFPGLDRVQKLASELRESSGECIVLSVQRGHIIQFLSILRGPDAVPDHVGEGLSAPLIGTAAGGAILMRKPPAEIAKIVKRTYHLKDPHRAANAVMGQLQSFKDRGYASVTREEFMPGLWAVAVPVPSRGCGASIALGIGGSKARIQPRERELAELALQHIERVFH
jgi:DNA-binding IclR family transcriptional regulator